MSTFCVPGRDTLEGDASEEDVMHHVVAVGAGALIVLQQQSMMLAG